MFKRRRKYITFGAIVTFLFVALYNGLVVRTYNVSTDKLEVGQSLRIVLLSDLHGYSYGNNLTSSPCQVTCSTGTVHRTPPST